MSDMNMLERFKIADQNYTLEVTEDTLTVRRVHPPDTGLKDALNKSIRLGDTIAYPVRSGSHMYMQSGKVVGTKLSGNPWSGLFVLNLRVEITKSNRFNLNKPKVVTVKRLDRVVKV